MKTIYKISFIIIATFSHSYAEIRNLPADFETIQAGINEANDGDTLLVAPGRYVETLTFQNLNGNQILVGSYFILARDDQLIDRTIIDGNGDDNGGVVMFWQDGVDNVHLSGFTIVNGEHYGIGFYNASSIVSYCRITGNPYGGIFVSDRQTPTIQYCRIFSNGGHRDAPSGGISCQNSSPVVINCVIHGNNTGQDNGGISIHRGGSPDIINSIIYGNNGNQVEIEDGTITYSNIQGGHGGAGNIDGNPQFENGFHLSADSPCIDTGSPGSPEDPDGTFAGLIMRVKVDGTKDPIELSRALEWRVRLNGIMGIRLRMLN